MRELDGRVRSPLGLETRVRRPSGDPHPVGLGALARGLQSAVLAGLQNEHRFRAPSLGLDERPRGGRADLLVAGDQDGDTVASVHSGEGVQQLDQTGFHVEAARPGRSPVDDRERTAAQCPYRPHGVQVPEKQDPGIPTKPPEQVRSGVGVGPLSPRPKQALPDLGHAGRTP